MLEFAGFPNPAEFPAIPANNGVPAETAAQVFAEYSPYICHCTTPVKPYNKNLQPGSASPMLTRQRPSSRRMGHQPHPRRRCGRRLRSDRAVQATAESTALRMAKARAAAQEIPPSSSTPASQLHLRNLSSNQGTNPTAINGVNGPTIPCVAAGTCSVLSAIPPWTIPGISVNPLSSTGNYNFTTFFPDHRTTTAAALRTTCTAHRVASTSPIRTTAVAVLQFISYNFQVQTCDQQEGGHDRRLLRIADSLPAGRRGTRTSH